MQTDTIKIAFVNAPRGNSKSANVKTDGGVYYSIPPGMMSQFQPGGTYQVDYEVNGQWKNVKAARAVSTPAHIGGSASVSRSRTDPQDSANMHTCAILVGMIRAGLVPLNEQALTAAEVLIRKAHRAAQLALRGAIVTQQPPTPPPPPLEDEISDSIPF